MTDKQRKFCDEYLIDCNATRAYRKAYPNVKKDSSAAVCAAKLLRIAKVQEYINKQLEKISSEKIADAKEVMEYLTALMRGQHTEQTLQFVGDGVQKIADINVLAKERLKAAELLGKRYGLFTDKIEVDGNAKVVITDDIPKDGVNE